jgi:protein CWC15
LEGTEDETNKRRKLLQDALELDKDDEDEDEKEEQEAGGSGGQENGAEDEER